MSSEEYDNKRWWMPMVLVLLSGAGGALGTYFQVRSSLEQSIQLTVTEQVKSFIRTQETKISELTVENKELKEENRELEGKLYNLQSRIYDLEVRIKDIINVKLDTQAWLNSFSFPAWIKKCPEAGTNDKPIMVYLNDAYTAIYGITRRQYIGKTDYEVYPKEVADVFYTNDMAVCESDKDVVKVEKVYRGTLNTYVQSHKYRFPLPSGGRGVAGVAIDCDCEFN